MYYAQKKHEEAIDWARKAIERKPDCDGAYNILGRALFESEQWKEAVALVDRAIEANGDDYNVYIPYLASLAALGDTEGVARFEHQLTRALEQQIDMVPEDARARILLATNCGRVGRKREAAEQLEKAVAMRPNDPNTLYNAACTYGVMAMKAEALAMFSRAVESGYSNAEWAARDSDLACLHGDPEFERLLKECSRKT
jgi:non-specific serine/threonine protein kinase